MDASFFIASRIRFRRKIVMISIAVSFLVMIIAVAVSSGFRREIRNGLSEVAGDVQLTLPDLNYLEESRPVDTDPAFLPYVLEMDEVESVDPVIYRAGIVKSDEDIYGILVKGIEGGVSDSLGLAVAIPSSFAEMSGLKAGDRLLTYFIGEKIKVRQFNIAEIYDDLLSADGRFLVYADIADMRRLNEWDAGQASLMEVRLKSDITDEQAINAAASEIGYRMNTYASEEDDTLVATSSVSRYPQLFDWLGLIDFNVFFILMLMTVVAGFNMISGLLIMLFENISTIGLLKSLGMTDRAIAKVFLSSSAVLVLKGMAIGNAIAFLICIIQDTTHLLRLDPENYFVSSVPVNLDFSAILIADAAAFIVIMLLLLIPSLFISRVDPAETVRVR